MAVVEIGHNLLLAIVVLLITAVLLVFLMVMYGIARATEPDPLEPEEPDADEQVTREWPTSDPG